jgi:hypothetical protein
MKALRLMVTVIMISGSAMADIITFEDLPLANMFLGGGQNIGSFYPTLTFGADVTGLDLTGSTAYPPHSGNIVIWSPSDPIVSIAFALPQGQVGIWYTSFEPLTLTAFDSGNMLLGSLVGDANTDGATGFSNFLSFSGTNIASITLSSSPGSYVLDDVTFTGAPSSSPVPEPNAVLLVAALLIIIVLIRRKGLRFRTEEHR